MFEDRDYTIVCMNRIAKFVSTILLAAAVFGAEGAEEDAGSRRRYPRRRFYTKRINVFDQDAAKELKLPDPEEKGEDKSGLPLENEEAPLMRDMSSGTTASPRMPRRRPRGKKKDEDRNSWIVKAFTDLEDEDVDSEEEEDSLSRDWGWLAEDSGLLSKSGREEGGSVDSDEAFELESEKMRIMRELLREDEVEQGADGDRASSNAYETAGKQLFVDFDEESRKRFDIFRSIDEDPKQSDSEDEEKKKTGKEKYDVAGDMDLDPEGRDDDYGRPSQTVTFLDKYRNADPEASGMLGSIERHEGRKPAARQSFSKKIEQRSKFKSAFDRDMGSKFKSPFESSFDKAAADRNANSGYGSPQFESRFEPIGDRSGGYSPPKARNFGRSDSDSLPDPIRDSKKKLPYSVRQWD